MDSFCLETYSHKFAVFRNNESVTVWPFDNIPSWTWSRITGSAKYDKCLETFCTTYLVLNHASIFLARYWKPSIKFGKSRYKDRFRIPDKLRHQLEARVDKYNQDLHRKFHPADRTKIFRPNLDIFCLCVLTEAELRKVLFEACKFY